MDERLQDRTFWTAERGSGRRSWTRSGAATVVENDGAVSVVAYLHPNARALRLEGDAVKHALIIEDNALIAVMIRDYLEECGYVSFDLASTQGEAIQFAERRCPDLITADDRLESGSGVEAIRHICHDRAIPVIFIVADPTNVRRALPNALLLQKPFSERALAIAIQAAEKVPQDFA